VPTNDLDPENVAPELRLRFHTPSPVPRKNVFLVYNAATNAPEEPFAAPARRTEYIAGRDFTPI
jgi:hypothetical protein